MKPKKHWEDIPVSHPREKVPVQIAGDGGIATPGAVEGRMVPVLILDTTDRPDLDELIRVHAFIETGDVKVNWTELPKRPDSIALLLRFDRPTEGLAYIEFDLNKGHGLLVEHILVARALYIQAGRPGDRLKHDLNKPKVIVEIPDTGLRHFWDTMYLKYNSRVFRERGLDRASAKRAAQVTVAEVRKLANVRVPTD